MYVITISAQGNILFVNRAIESKFGYAPQQILERSIIDVFIPPNKKEEMINDIETLLDGACGNQIAIPFMSRDYQVRDILWDVTYFKDESGVITSINLLGLDVTEQNILKGTAYPCRQTEQPWHHGFKGWRMNSTIPCPLS